MGRRPDYQRQRAIFNPAEHQARHVTVIGLGNIGSHGALAIARLGIAKLTLYDHDKVEAHNLSSQAYTVDDIGEYKGKALARHIIAVNPDISLDVHTVRYRVGRAHDPIVVLAVDSIEARREIGEALGACYVVDGRMGGGQVEVWSGERDTWRATLEGLVNSDDPCAARYISYTSYIIAGLIANNIKRHILGERVHGRILLHTDTLEMLRQ